MPKTAKTPKSPKISKKNLHRDKNGSKTSKKEKGGGEGGDTSSVGIPPVVENEDEGEENEEMMEGFEEEEDEENGEEEDEGNEEDFGEEDHVENNEDEHKSPLQKPQIWVRIKQNAPIDSVYEIGQDGKTLKLTIRPEDRLFQKKEGKTHCFSFETEGILHGAESSQRDIYAISVKDVVDNAFQGVSGVVVCVGPEQSGKSFSLFGPEGEFGYRGILPRALEDIFTRLETIKNADMHVILSMFEIRKDKMKDLITLSATDLNRVGNFGPKGLFFEEVLTVDHALGLIIRGLAGQQLMPCEVHPNYAKYHTVIYLDILASVKATGESWRSRITFAKIASMPAKTRFPITTEAEKNNFPMFRNAGCTTMFSSRKDNCFSTDGIVRKCCGGPSGELAEGIHIRKDMYFLEQMFTKSFDVRKASEYYNELKKLGMYMLMNPPNTSPSQFFRQSKLAYCLKDIVSGNALVRLILHVRPDRQFVNTTLEMMRFAERARYIPCEITKRSQSSLDQKRCEEAGVNTTQDDKLLMDKQNRDKAKGVFKNAATFFEDKMETLEGSCKDQVKEAFDGFQKVWEGMLDKEFMDNLNNDEEMQEFEEEGVADNEEEAIESVSQNELEPPEKTKKPNKVSSKKLKNKDKDQDKDKDNDKEKNGNKLEEKKSKKQKAKASASKGDRKKGDPSNKELVVDDADTVANNAKEKTKEKKRKKASKAQLQTAPAPPPATAINEEIHHPEEHHEKEKKVESEDDSTTVISNPDAIKHELSISVVPVGSNVDRMDGNNSLIANLHFKCKCWETFAKSEAGTPLVAELADKQALLEKFYSDHNETLKEVISALSKLVSIEMNLDKMEPNRRFSEETDKINLLTTKEQRKETAEHAQQALKKFQEQQTNMRSMVSLVNEFKQECDKAFDQFCIDSTKKSEGGNRPVLEGELEDRYDEINRIAKEEAQILIKKAYPKRPPWTTYY